jgi:hypothetical protein
MQAESNDLWNGWEDAEIDQRFNQLRESRMRFQRKLDEVTIVRVDPFPSSFSTILNGCFSPAHRSS